MLELHKKQRKRVTWVSISWHRFSLEDGNPALGESTGFVQTLESPGIKMLRFPGLESPGKKA